MLVAIDPGANQGWALFDLDGRLVRCGLGAPPAATYGVVERPVIYPRGQQRARPRDIITLALRAGETAGALRAAGACVVEYVEPRVWKRGAIKKAVSHRRIRAKLTAAELRVVAAGSKGLSASKKLDVLDAVGIGLFTVGR